MAVLCNGLQAVFLDRDGTLIKDKAYAANPQELELETGVIEGLQLLRKHRIKCIVVTNQSGIGRGYFTETRYKKMTEKLIQEFGKYQIQFEEIYHCPHIPEDRCGCRKPSPGLLQIACQKFHLTPAETVMIGDKKSDILCGKALGCKTILVRTGEGHAAETQLTPDSQPDYTADTITDAVKNYLKIR